MKDAVIDPVEQPGEPSTWNPMDRRFAAAAAPVHQGIEKVVGVRIDPGSSVVPFANLAEILKEMPVLPDFIGDWVILTTWHELLLPRLRRLVNWEASKLAVGTRRLALHGPVLNHCEQGRRWKWGRPGHSPSASLLLDRNGRDGVEPWRQLVLLHGPHEGNHGGQLDGVVGALCNSRRTLL